MGKKDFIPTVAKELLDGENLLSDISYAVTFFGSARISEGVDEYKQARLLANKLALLGVNIITGGGPGIMEAANRGAFESGMSESVGLNIVLEHEQLLNPYVTRSAEFINFFTRKLMLRKYSSAFVIFPGGFGTLDELVEILTLTQTRKMEKKRVYLYSSVFYNPLLDFMRKSMLASGMIQESDFDIFKVFDNIDEIMGEIITHKESLQ